MTAPAILPGASDLRGRDPIGFIHGLGWDDLPDEVVHAARRCTLDLLGVAAAGATTRLSEIACGYAARHLGSAEGGARILFDGRRASPAGAAFAGASQIDSFDGHDGHVLTKGHCGVAILPTVLAMADDGRPLDGREFLVAVVLGYEIAIRAGISLHADARDYHTSGAWNALGCAAVVARRLGLSREATREALGIAEYHGPRSQMMRCIEHPTMVKDGSGWGALAGVSAAFLADEGFTGAPAITVEDAAKAEIWDDLGQRWRILEQYLKPFPVCYWAQPALVAARALMDRHDIRPDRIAAVRVHGFAAAVALGARRPRTTEEAQYALAFPLAALLIRGEVATDEIAGSGLADPAILAMVDKVALFEDPAFTARFPAERLARVTIERDDGTVFVSDPTGPRGLPSCPLSDADVSAKFHALATRLPPQRRAAIERAVEGLGHRDEAVPDLLEAVLAPIPLPMTTTQERLR